MSDVFISYARATAMQARAVADGLRAEGYSVWSDDDLPTHRAYSDVIEERLATAKAVVVIWSAEAVKSEWVRSEANRAREDRKLVQLSLDGARLPMPFDQIQCADLAGWSGERAAPGWLKVAASVAALAAASPVSPPVSSPVSAPPPAPLAPSSTLPPTLPSKPSIAVMPFANLSNDADQEYFSDGMTEEIVGALSRFRSIFVIASSSTMTFKGAPVSPQEAGRLLGVRFVLEGSVRKAAGQVRIAARLLDASDATQVWGDRFDEPLDDVFALQDRVAASVAAVIVPRVSEAEIRRVSRTAPDDGNAYDLYLRALPHYRSVGGAEGTRQALQLLTRAAELDPANGAVLSLAASCHSRLRGMGWSDDDASHRRQAVDLARRSLQAAGDDPDVLIRAASVLAHETSEDVSRIFERAIGLNPTSASAHVIIGNYRLSEGDAVRAQQHLETSMRLDPLSPTRASQLGLLGGALFSQRRYAEALAVMSESVQTHTVAPIGYAVLAACCGFLGEAQRGAEALERARALTPLTMPELVTNLIRDEATRAHLLEGLRLTEAGAATCA